jgi:hypothetical protein
MKSIGKVKLRMENTLGTSGRNHVIISRYQNASRTFPPRDIRYTFTAIQSGKRREQGSGLWICKLLPGLGLIKCFHLSEITLRGNKMKMEAFVVDSPLDIVNPTATLVVHVSEA